MKKEFIKNILDSTLLSGIYEQIEKVILNLKLY